MCYYSKEEFYGVQRPENFITLLENRGLLHRIKAEVDPLLEISEITDRMSKSPNGGKALLFENVKGSSFLLPQTSSAHLKGCASHLK